MQINLIFTVKSLYVSIIYTNFALVMMSPYILPPSPETEKAADEVREKVHAYMRMHPESELHRCGKMFGVLIVRHKGDSETSYLAAFSAKLDGSYRREGFVPPVVEMMDEPVGHNKEESRRLQKLLFASYYFVNGKGERKNLLEIFEKEKAIIPLEEWFGKKLASERMPPAGAGECCGPKLLQYALTHDLEPIALAEFWIGAPSKTDIRQEGGFYTPCSGKCGPILKHMLEGIEVKGVDAKKSELEPEVIYEDAWLVVVNKPARMLSVPGKGEEPSAESYFKSTASDVKSIKAVHRLDQDTSGLLVLAKTEDVYKELQAYFQRRDILKRYEAVVKPHDAAKLPDEGMIELPLLPNPYDRPRQMIDSKHGKVAITRYAVRDRRADGSVLVDFYPLTGRTHQLRVHAAHPKGLNAPIVGDRLYGLDSKESGGRMMLHAAEIRFAHPVTKEEMHFCIPSNF